MRIHSGAAQSIGRLNAEGAQDLIHREKGDDCKINDIFLSRVIIIEKAFFYESVRN